MSRIGRKKRPYKKRINPQTKPSRVVCHCCFLVIAPKAKQIKTSKGIAHYNCVIDQVFKRLKAQKLPLPSVFSLSRDFLKYLKNQAEILMWQAEEDVEYKLTEILDISEEIFGVPIQLSTLMARQSQGLSPQKSVGILPAY